MRALGEGILAGLGIAVPVGPIAVLLIDLGIRRGFTAALPAGLGAASADFAYAAVAAILGAAAADVLDPVADPLRIASVVVLVAIAGLRVRELLRDRCGDPARAPAARDGLRLYLAFLGLTLLNPVTVAYFVALIIGLQATRLLGPTAKVLFVIGAFAASAAWQTVLVGTGSVLHHRLPGRARLVTGLVGAVVIVGLAVRLALAQAGTSASAFAANTKSDSCSPPILCVKIVSFTRPQPSSMSGWWPTDSASSPTRLVKASASAKSLNRNSFSRWWSSTTRQPSPRSAR